MAFHVIKPITSQMNRTFADWLERADEMYLQWLDMGLGSPFELSKGVSVDFLSCSAARAGLVAVTDRHAMKVSPLANSCREDPAADLWLYGGCARCSFRLRRCRRDLTGPYLALNMEYVEIDAGKVRSCDCRAGFCGVLAVAHTPDYHRICIEYADSGQIDFCGQLGPLEQPAFVFLKHMR